jgi:hypothetical protein
MGKLPTVHSYIENHHLGPADNPKIYYDNLKAKLSDVDKTLTFSPDDSTQKWVGDNNMWKKLFAAFRSAEGWFGGEAITTSNVDSTSSKPGDALLVAYYKSLLGVAAAPMPQLSLGATPPAKP